MDVASNSAYPTPYANSSLLPLLLLSLAQQRNAPVTKDTFKKEYDYVIVGAGSAGAVVASRLSEIPCVSVLLLEAGKSAPLLNEVPVLARNFWFTDLDWQFKTVPQKYCGDGVVNNQVIWPSGKALGGGSVLNAMIYLRGNRQNYDQWARGGAVGWSYTDMFPYFLKLEDQRSKDYLGNGYHVIGGPISAEKPPYASELKAPVFETAKFLNYNVVDPNGANITGFYDNEATIRNAQRCSTAKGYLVPAENRTNLDILQKAFVRKVTFSGKRASGVEFDFKGKKHTVRAKREVILSAGTTNTVQLLMLSGIGPKKHLRKMKIPVVEDLPVGDSFQDHASASFIFEVDPSVPKLVDKIVEDRYIKEYIDNRTGPLASAEGVSALAFFGGDPKLDFPEIEHYFVDVAVEILKFQVGLKPNVFEQYYGPYAIANSTLCNCHIQLNQPRSRGTVRLNSTNPYDPPLIDPNYYADPEDTKKVVEGMKWCEKFITSEPMQKFGAKLLTTEIPGCEKFANDKDKRFACRAKAVPWSLSHQVATAKMGSPDDPTTVVDPQLRVKNIQGLRVVDASVMPIVPSVNTNIPVIAVAERASDIIKASIYC